MRARAHDDPPRKQQWMQAVAFVCLALTLFAAVLDRRNAIIDRIAAPPGRVVRPVAPPTPAEMVREMLTHD